MTRNHFPFSPSPNGQTLSYIFLQLSVCGFFISHYLVPGFSTTLKNKNGQCLARSRCSVNVGSHTHQSGLFPNEHTCSLKCHVRVHIVGTFLHPVTLPLLIFKKKKSTALSHTLWNWIPLAPRCSTGHHEVCSFHISSQIWKAHENISPFSILRE